VVRASAVRKAVRLVNHPLRALLYARASTRDKQHPEHQLEELRVVARQRGWTVLDERVERASGARADRLELAELLEVLRLGQADVLAAVELSRIGRSVPHLVELAGQLKDWGAQLVISRQAIETTTPSGRWFFVNMAALAQLERELTQERVLAGVASARARRGGRWGKRLVVPGDKVALAVSLRSQGAPWPKVAEAVGHPVGTVRDAVRRATCGQPAAGVAPEPAQMAGQNRKS